MFFAGNQSLACTMLQEQGYIPHMLSKSRFNRRLHRIAELCLVVLAALAEYWKEWNGDSIYAIDSFPIAVCDNIRIRRAKIYHDEAYRGYCASKKRYFYGVKVHLVVTKDGHPVEIRLTPGATADVTVLEAFDLDWPPQSELYADCAYTDYTFEDDFEAVEGLQESHFLPMRKRHSKRPAPPWQRYLQHCPRKMVETTGSLVERLLPKSIHAVTARGFELKVILIPISAVSAPPIYRHTAGTGLPADVRILAAAPLSPTLLYAGTWGDGVYRSVNHGANWSTATAGLTLAVNPVAF